VLEKSNVMKKELETHYDAQNHTHKQKALLVEEEISQIKIKRLV
jgi:hypothetical protein